MPCYAGMRHLLKLDIFPTSVRQSLNRTHEGAAIWTLGKQLNRNKTRHWECLVDRQTFFFPLLDVCNNWISTEQQYHVDGLKSCCLKKYSWPVCFTDVSTLAARETHQWSSVFIHSIAEYWALHSVYWEVTVWLATFFSSCVGYMTIGITLYQKPRWVML